ncbi:PSME3-interacting protein-like [Tubulanus polymorphus]|uniref:PSME3-interacting protein-like n=1 Tax=Tubulanus polymorphus TaxID=672921 RepID=UPI003DA61463
MSFTNTETTTTAGASKAAVPAFKKFVSEDEIVEKRRQRQEEWEKVRNADDPVEAPEEEYDPRSLYERLQAQKDAKQEEHDEKYKLKNQVKGLESDEVEFLDFVSQRQLELENQRFTEDEAILSEFRTVSSTSAATTSAADKKSSLSKAPAASSSGKTSQKSLLAGIVKRKSTNSDELAPSDKNKKSKTTDEIVDKSEIEPSEKQLMATAAAAAAGRKAIAILPGIGEYTDSSAENTDDSSSESDGELGGLGLMSDHNGAVVIHAENGQKIVVNGNHVSVQQ